MAKQKGIVKFEGTLDGINFYMREGVAVARKAGGGFTSSVVKNSPNMERVRENSTEFGRSSQIKRLIKGSLFVLLKDYKDPSLHARMMRLMQEIKVLDLVSVRGKRKIEHGLQTALGKKLFFDFLFTAKYRLATMATVVAMVDSATYSCTITGFDLKNIPFPQGATHLKFTYLVCTYDFEALSFVNYESSVFFDSECDLIPSFSFTPDLPLMDLKNVICFCGISFYQQIGTEKFVLKNTNALGITCVHIGL